MTATEPPEVVVGAVSELVTPLTLAQEPRRSWRAGLYLIAHVGQGQRHNESFARPSPMHVQRMALVTGHWKTVSGLSVSGGEPGLRVTGKGTELV